MQHIVFTVTDFKDTREKLGYMLKRSVATPLEVTLFATCLIRFEVSKNLDHNPLTMTQYNSAAD